MSELNNNIVFRRIAKNDLQILKKWRNSYDIWQFNTQFILLNMKHQKEWFSNMEKNSERKMYMVNINKQPIGVCGLVHIDNVNKNADIAILIGKSKFRERGISKKILEKILEIGFKKLHFNRIGAEVLDSNTNSQKFFENMNFTYETTLREVIWRNSKWQNIHVYSILKTEWKKNHSQSSI